MIPPLLFEVPSLLQSQVMSGALRQVGALILNPQTGRIVAHLQETGDAQQLSTLLINAGPSAFSAIASPLSAVGSIATYVQNRQILASLEALQGLQIGGLVLNGLGLGVSLAGFAVMSAKLDRLTVQIKAIDDRLARIESRIEDLHDAEIQRDFVALRAVCKQIDDAWSVANPSLEWSAAAGVLYQLEARFFDRARQAQNAPTLAIDRFESFIDAALLASAGLVSVRTAMDDLNAAQIAAADTVNSLNSLTNRIGILELVDIRLRKDMGLTLAGKIDALARHRVEAFAHLALFRAREDQAFSASHTISYLNRSGYSGRAYLEALRESKEAPIAIVKHEET
jgi:hypothetical protein